MVQKIVKYINELENKKNALVKYKDHIGAIASVCTIVTFAMALIMTFIKDRNSYQAAEFYQIEQIYFLQESVIAMLLEASVHILIRLIIVFFPMVVFILAPIGSNTVEKIIFCFAHVILFILYLFFCFAFVFNEVKMDIFNHTIYIIITLIICLIWGKFLKENKNNQNKDEFLFFRGIMTAFLIVIGIWWWTESPKYTITFYISLLGYYLLICLIWGIITTLSIYLIWGKFLKRNKNNQNKNNQNKNNQNKNDQNNNDQNNNEFLLRVIICLIWGKFLKRNKNNQNKNDQNNNDQNNNEFPLRVIMTAFLIISYTVIGIWWWTESPKYTITFYISLGYYLLSCLSAEYRSEKNNSIRKYHETSMMIVFFIVIMIPLLQFSIIGMNKNPYMDKRDYEIVQIISASNLERVEEKIKSDSINQTEQGDTEYNYRNEQNKDESPFQVVILHRGSQVLLMNGKIDGNETINPQEDMSSSNLVIDTKSYEFQEASQYRFYRKTFNNVTTNAPKNND